METEIRKFIYERLVATGSPPSYPAIASELGLSVDQAGTLARQMRIGKTLLTHPGTGEIWMAGPFSASPTQYRVKGRTASWWANCAWDMFGVAMIVDEKVEIESTCTDCGEPWTLAADPEQPPTDEGIVHFLLPARQWYEDIGFT